MAIRPLQLIVLAGLVCGAVLVAVVLLIVIRTWRNATDVFDPPRAEHAAWPTGTAAPPGLRDVEFASTDGLRIRGWYVRGTSPGTVIILHGGKTDRRQMTPEAAALSSGGLGVLLYDEPGAGSSEGHVTYGPLERDALRGAIAWLQTLEPQGPIGLLGFSQGAFIAGKFGCDQPIVSALALTGVFVDFPEQTRFTFRRWGPISQWAALAARRWAGYVPTEPSMTTAVSAFGKPLLIVSGGRDTDVPADHARRLFDAAASPKHHWIIPEAGHGNYMAVAPAEYSNRLISFFRDALQPLQS